MKFESGYQQVILLLSALLSSAVHENTNEFSTARLEQKLAAACLAGEARVELTYALVWSMPNNEVDRASGGC